MNMVASLDAGAVDGEASSPLTIDYRPIAALIPYARNARTHSDGQVAQIAASIREFGWTNPVLVDADNGIVAGHGRVLAARKLGMAEVPVIELAGLSEAQKRALVIADNKLALNAGWDDELLGLELADLGELGFDLALTGFGEGEILALTSLGTAGLTDPDDAPALPKEPVSKPGDLWLLGKHRLICGDSTDKVVVDRVLAGVKPHLVVSDPPYGVNYDPAWRVRAGVADAGNTATGKVLNDDRADWREAWALFPGDVAYVWHGALHAAEVAASLEAAGFAIRSQIVWDKTRLVIGRGDYHWQHEPAWYCVRKGRTGHWAGDRKQTTVWAIPHRRSETGHGTQKPVECMRRPIENNSSPGQAVYEPFSGSGTTIIAAEMTGRSCHAVELDPAYVDVAVTRWQAFTGEVATLDGDGRSFDEIAAVARCGIGQDAGGGVMRESTGVQGRKAEDPIRRGSAPVASAAGGWPRCADASRSPAWLSSVALQPANGTRTARHACCPGRRPALRICRRPPRPNGSGSRIRCLPVASSGTPTARRSLPTASPTAAGWRPSASLPKRRCCQAAVRLHPAEPLARYRPQAA